jgi:uncharacterized protein (DUF1697 family)
MSSHAAFLRGMNVGVHHRVSNDELRRILSASGLSEVETFRASGNVAFTASRESLEQLRGRVEASLARELGYAVPAFLRTAEEIRAIAATAPFAPELVEASAGKIQVSILPQRPSARRRKEVLALAGDEDLLAFGECELYWLPSGGTLDSALDLKAIERMIGPSTRRTKNMLEQMAGKHFAG